jgi:hypothetical protein
MQADAMCAKTREFFTVLTFGNVAGMARDDHVSVPFNAGKDRFSFRLELANNPKDSRTTLENPTGAPQVFKVMFDVQSGND